MRTRLVESRRRLEWPPAGVRGEELATREWLITNGLGGYASGTVSGVVTRRYHGLLIAALAAPLGRMVMLSHVADAIVWPDDTLAPLTAEQSDNLQDPDSVPLVEFRLEWGMPVWRYQVRGVTLEKRVFLTHAQNTVHVSYELIEGADRIGLTLRPSVNFRAQEQPVSEPLAAPYEFHVADRGSEISLTGSAIPRLRLLLHAGESTFVLDGKRHESLLYQVEESRGYDCRGDLWSPGLYRLTIARGHPAVLVASTESFEAITALDPERAREAEKARRRRLVAQAVPQAREGVPAELVLAADQFIITPAGRTEDTLRALAHGDEVRTVVAGYHWFTDWGRDTMISLEGLALITGRTTEAAYILRTFANYVRDGLIPNMFPEGEREGLYHTADASLWFFHAVSRYISYTDDELTLAALYPRLREIVDAHRRGTRFGIRVDDRDGLLVQGEPGYQLTWMDAKVDDWVVTPRRGKAVEINALWYNALRLMEVWALDFEDAASAREYGAAACRVEQSFNNRFWYGTGQYLYDVVDGEDGEPDARCRPNQILAVALPHPVLAPAYWAPVVRIVSEQLLTPVGLRSLSPDDRDFKPRYYGDLRARDAAYHQGTVWAWLVGPFVDAWLRAFPEDQSAARRVLDGFVAHMDEACIGSVSEIFDANAPFMPRGCISQAWSVAEVLRAWVKLSGIDEVPY